MSYNSVQGPTWALSPVELPEATVLTIEEARMQLRVDPEPGTSPPSHPEDELILDCVRAATGELDGGDGWLGRALLTQTWRLSLNRFPDGEVLLPLPPLQEVLSVTYLDTDGVERTLAAGTDYRVGTEGRVAYVAAAHGKRWPRGREQGGAVGITFRCGYGDEGSAVPALVRQYVKARLGFYYEHRETIVVGPGLTAPEVPGYAHVLENLRVRGVLS